MNIAVILAGGSGSRLGNDVPKQFLKVAGKQVIEHTIEVFENSPEIDEICIVSKADYVANVEELVIKNQYKKVKKILNGGKERYDSSLAAINAYTDDNANLLFHDAVRPLVNDRIIHDCIEALQQYNAVDVAAKTTDTIISVDDKECIDFIPNRAFLRNGQTPQCFKRGVIKRAYDIALADPDFVTTDDCGTVRRYLPDEPIYVVAGENSNMKLTYIEDLFLLDKLFQLRTKSGEQKHLTEEAMQGLKDKVLVIFGGSYGIGGEIIKIGQEHHAHIYSFSRSQNGCDVSLAEDVHKALAEVADKEGHIDIVVNTAGILVKEALISMTQEAIMSSLNINLLGVINVAREAFPYLHDTRGSLLFYTSSSYTRGRMMYSLYSATKAAIVNFVQAIAEEWHDFGIRVNCINPERTKTPMRVQNFGNEPEGTLLPAEDVAVASLNTVFSHATGEVIDVRRKKIKLMNKNYSVIIPHHNSPQLLERCIASIPEREDIEVLVVDDNSDADYLPLIAQICSKRSNVIYTPTTDGLGAGYARNVALKQVHSKWVLFADADDYFMPDAWEHLDKHLNDEADLIYFHSTCRFSDTGEPSDRHVQLVNKVDAFIQQPNEMTEGRLRYNYNEPWGKMIRAGIIKDNHLEFEQTRWANDLHFSTMVGACAKTIAADTAEIYCVTIAHGSLVHQHSLESRRCRYEVILRNNAYLRQIGKPKFQDSLMYSLKWAAKLGGVKAVWEFIKIGRANHGDFMIGAGSWIQNFFHSKNEYKNRSKYIVKN